MSSHSSSSSETAVHRTCTNLEGSSPVRQALPIWRGGGVDQPLLLDVARRLSAGNWVHIFPEGRVIQSGHLALDQITPRSADQLTRYGRLKWGVGKLIAHSPVPPLVIPLHHQGMPAILPQNKHWREDGRGGVLFDNKVISWVPGTGHRVRVEFGPPVEVASLLRAHEAARGPLPKVSPEAHGWHSALPW